MKCFKKEIKRKKFLAINSIPISTSKSSGFSLAISNNKKVICFGNNEYGALGNNPPNKIYPPNFLNTQEYISVSCGFSHSLLLNGNGKVFSIGNNSFGELGNLPLENRTFPEEIYLSGGYDGTNCVNISAGTYFSLILLDNGNVLSFGYNLDGALGLSDYENRIIPTLIPSISKAISISAGSRGSLVLLEDGKVLAFGSNEYGALGIGQLYEKTNVPVNVILEEKCVSISSGTDYSLFLTKKGNVYSSGHNEYGNLGTGNENDVFIPVKIQGKYIFICAGQINSFFIDKDGNLYGCGYGGDGNLGNGTFDNSSNVIKLPISNCIYISSGMVTFVLLSNGAFLTSGVNTNTYYQLGRDTGGVNSDTFGEINIDQIGTNKITVKIKNLFFGKIKLKQTIERGINYLRQINGKKYTYSYPLQNSYLEIIK